MAAEFRAVFDPPDGLLDDIAVLAPENPFYTAVYASAIRQCGLTPVALFLESDGTLVSGCTAFAGTGRIDQRLDITSLPRVADEHVFWSGLVEFCKDNGISVLGINTFGSNEAAIPKLDGETARKSRIEFQLKLAGVDLWDALNRRNRRAVKKAVDAGLNFQQAEGAGACRIHARVANSSLCAAAAVVNRSLTIFRSRKLGHLSKTKRERSIKRCGRARC